MYLCVHTSYIVYIHMYVCMLPLSMYQCVLRISNFHRVDWIYWFQGMVILAANQVWWTWEVEDTFMKVKKGDKLGLKNYSRKLHTQISEVVVKVHIRMLYTYIKHICM